MTFPAGNFTLKQRGLCILDLRKSVPWRWFALPEISLITFARTIITDTSYCRAKVTRITRLKTPTMHNRDYSRSPVTIIQGPQKSAFFPSVLAPLFQQFIGVNKFQFPMEYFLVSELSLWLTFMKANPFQRHWVVGFLSLANMAESHPVTILWHIFRDFFYCGFRLSV